MAIPVARVHLAMAHAALPGLLPNPPKCMMVMPPLLPTPPCAIILPSSSPLKPSRADAAERWDAHKIKPGGSPTSSSSGGRRSLDGESSSPGRASSSERWDSNKKKNAAAAAASSSASRTSSPGRSSSSRADSEERWDAHKKPMSLTSSSSSSARSINTKGCDSSKRGRPSSRASSTAARWDARKKPTATRTDELDDGESSTGSNDMEYKDMIPPPRPLPQQRALYAGRGFIASPDPSMLPMPSLMIRVAKRRNTRGMLLAKC